MSQLDTGSGFIQGADPPQPPARLPMCSRSTDRTARWWLCRVGRPLSRSPRTAASTAKRTSLVCARRRIADSRPWSQSYSNFAPIVKSVRLPPPPSRSVLLTRLARRPKRPWMCGSFWSRRTTSGARASPRWSPSESGTRPSSSGSEPGANSRTTVVTGSSQEQEYILPELRELITGDDAGRDRCVDRADEGPHRLHPPDAARPSLSTRPPPCGESLPPVQPSMGGPIDAASPMSRRCRCPTSRAWTTRRTASTGTG
jgi:hypothetical protein